MTTIYVQRADDLALGSLIASELAAQLAIECRAALLEAPLEKGALCVVRVKASMRKKKRASNFDSEVHILGPKVPMIVTDHVVSSTVNEPREFDEHIAGSVARQLQAILVEQARTTPRTVALYSLYCGMDFARVMVETLEGAGFPCEVRPEHWGSYPERPWGRIAPDPSSAATRMRGWSRRTWRSVRLTA